MPSPFILWNPKANVSHAADDGAFIAKYPISPPTVHPGPYENADESGPTSSLHYTPPLAYFCIKVLSAYPDQIHVMGSPRLQYSLPESPQSFDILRALIPASRLSEPDPCDPFSFDMFRLDPRVWATLAQIYSPLPTWFHTHSLPLSDTHLPLLQSISPTPNFALVTVLELQRCKDLCDNTVGTLSKLHGLVAFDASGTSLGTYGIQVLVRGLGWKEDHAEERETTPSRRGPCGLRILRLQHCHRIDDGIYDLLPKFPLLCAVDLRHTNCSPQYIPSSEHQLHPTCDTTLFYPQPLRQALSALESSAERLGISFYSAPKTSVFRIHIASLHHRPTYKGRQPKFSDNFRVFDQPALPEPIKSSSMFLQPSSENSSKDAWNTDDYNSVNAIAALEASLTASHTASHAFYQGVVISRSELSEASLHDKVKQVSDGVPMSDTHMLLRIPPPNTVLDIFPSSSLHHTASIAKGASSAKLKLRHSDNVKRLVDMVKRRRVVLEDTFKVTSSNWRQDSVPTPPTKTKNPFSVNSQLKATRNIDSFASIESTPRSKSRNGDANEHWSIHNTTPRFRPNVPTPKPVSKPLRPITSLPVPKLPAELKPIIRSTHLRHSKSLPRKKAEETQSTLSFPKHSGEMGNINLGVSRSVNDKAPVSHRRMSFPSGKKRESPPVAMFDWRTWGKTATAAG